jgi:hypothetical protein
MRKNKTEGDGRREPAYPYYPFRTSIKLAEAVKDYGGGRDAVEKDVLAHELKMGQSSPSFAQVVASAKCFGMIEGRGSYRLTDESQKYFFPADQGESSKAKLAFFARPEAFQLLVKRFDGNKLPDAKTLGNILLRDGVVPKSWVARVTALFMDAANELGLIDEDGRLRYAVAMKKNATDTLRDGSESSVETPAQSHETRVTSNPLLLSVNQPQPQSEMRSVADASVKRSNVWSFSEAGGMVRVETPDPLPRVLWERLKRYVDVLEPAKEEETKKGVHVEPRAMA